MTPFKKPAVSSIGAYLNDIGRVPLLTADQEIELARKIQRMQELQDRGTALNSVEKRQVKAGKRAMDKFICANLRLVVSIAKKYQHMTKSLDLMDLVQEGNMGLIHGVLKFDPERGYKFSTYSYWWVRQAMSRAIRYKDRTVRLPGNIGEMAYSWSIRHQALRQKLGREPSLQDMAKAFKVPVEDVMLFFERGSHATSLDQAFGEDTQLVELIADPNDKDGEEAMDLATMRELIEAVKGSLHCLDPLQRQAMELRFGFNGHEPMTLTEIGRAQGTTRESARTRIKKACNKIKLQLHNTYATTDQVLEALAG